MDLRSVECVLKVAELQHFSHAASELHLSQPALSHRIRTLERELHVVLFDRDRRGVRVTAAGRAFLEPARAALQLGRRAADEALRASAGRTGHLRLGFTVIASYTALPHAVQYFRSTHPDVTVELLEVNSPTVEAALDRGELDLGILHPPLERPHLRQLPLTGEELVLAVPAGHRLAKRRRVRFSDLDGEPLLVAPRRVGPVLFDSLMARFRDSAVEPRIVQEATPVTTLTGLVAAGAGIGFVSRGIATATRPGVAFCAVTDAPVVPVAAAWATPEPTMIARHFLEVLKDTM
jgi:DNA-binding transcriptional LysR family regulator